VTRSVQGLRGWLLQRFTAMYLAVYLVYVLVRAALTEPLDYAQWRAWLADPWMGIATALFALALLVHAWLGVRDVLIDYVHPVSLRLLLMAAAGLMLLVSLLWIIRALLLVATGTGS
jgi:succinate dehydrogenase / fumarate reductase membrane anchor subunit